MELRETGTGVTLANPVTPRRNQPLPGVSSDGTCRAALRQFNGEG
jgi:hypothetical protein